MLDIDHFKRINDRFGHLYGDEVLLLFAKRLRDCFRGSDKLYRHGGEEFAVIIKGATEADVLAVLERLRKAIAEPGFPQVGTVTVSIGVTAIVADSLPSSIADRADRALYQAKQGGRNQVQLHRAVAGDGGAEAHAVELF